MVAVLQNLPLVLLLFGALLIPMFDKSISFINRIIAFCLRKIKSSRKLTLPFLRLRNQAIYSLSMFLIAIVLLIQSFGIPNYIYALTQSTKLYEENYVNPKTAKLTFPEKKRNLIYIYLESMENTLASKANGGSSETSVIPELEELALKKYLILKQKHPVSAAPCLQQTLAGLWQEWLRNLPAYH